MFIPKISLTGVPLTADSVIITDITGNTTDAVPDTTGYINATYAYYPQLNTIWHKFLKAQLLGTLPTQYYYDPISDKDGTSTAVGSIALTDGVWLIEEYWMRSTTEFTAGLNYTIDGTKKILTRTSGSSWIDNGAIPGLFEGLYGVAVSNPSESTLSNMKLIKSVTATTLTLSSALSASAVASNDPLNLYYRTQKYLLIMNKGEQSLVSDIGNLGIAELQGQGCNENTMKEYCKRLILKLSAQIAFNCGQYAKAHSAAILFSDSSSTNCCS